ncbi:transposase family protein [Bradyrhizobium sp. 160]|nr:transposase family protein [Bradyrhizobium sp. 160]
MDVIPETSIAGRRVARELTAIVQRRRKPEMIVSDHSTEFTCNAKLAWCKDAAIYWHFIAPGKPMQNGFVESFMYRRPRGCKSIFFAAFRISVGCVHVYGLTLRR